MPHLSQPYRFYAALLLFAALCLPAAAQNSPPTAAAITETTNAATQTITLTQIADQELNTEKTIQQLTMLIAQPLDFEVLSDKLIMTKKQITTLRQQSSDLIKNNKSSIDQIRINQSQWNFIREQLIKDQQKIRERSAELEGALAKLAAEEERWQQIKNQTNTEIDLNYDGISLKKSTNNISSLRKQLTTSLQESLTLDKEWQELLDATDQEQLALKNDERYLRNNLLNNIQDPIWKLRADDFIIQEGTAQSIRIQTKLAKHYLGQYLYNSFFVFVISMGTIFLIWQLRHHKKQAQENKIGLALKLPLIDKPISAVVGISAALALLIYPYPPQLVLSTLSLLLFIPVTRLGLSRLPAIVRPLAWLVSVFFIVNNLSALTDAAPALQRLWMLGIATVGFAGCIHALLKLSVSEERNSLLWKFLRTSIWLALIAALVAIIGGIIGAITLAQFLITGVAYSTYAGLCLVVVAGIFNDLAVAAIYMPASATSYLISRNRPLIVGYAGKITTIVCSLVWIHFTLDQFALWDGLVDFTTKLLNKQMQAGSLSVSLGDILAVTITIWLSFKISQLLRFFLVEDIAPRAKMARGVPEAIATLTQYCIVLAGFITAISIAGIDMSKLTIMAGALGVGIGIGLQDVVNNFTSGLILLFEQHIKQADIIQCSNVNGRVMQIGMRCSIVRTFDGAEVIVPNGQLVSAQVINWTHSDQERRISIPVGVAYGTDPQLAIDTLIKVARANSNILEDPAPAAFFLRFSASSMDFELRAWVRNGEIINEVNSQLCVEIVNQFKAAGINTPFPQQDIYVRSLPEGFGNKP